MKKNLLLILFSSLAFFSNSAFAQLSVASGIGVNRIVNCTARSAAIVISDSIVLDKRVRLHYSEAQLQKIKLIAPYKLEQLNFQYSSSFRIVNKLGKEVAYDAKKFDVHEYEKFRKENERVSFRLTRNGDEVELLSRSELNAIYEEIRNKYSK